MTQPPGDVRVDQGEGEGGQSAGDRELEALGEDVRRRLGRRAARRGDAAGPTPRKREVLRLVAAGLTHSGNAGELSLGPRTVDTRVRTLLAELGCHTRTEAAPGAVGRWSCDVGGPRPAAPGP